LGSAAGDDGWGFVCVCPAAVSRSFCFAIQMNFAGNQKWRSSCTARGRLRVDLGGPLRGGGTLCSRRVGKTRKVVKRRGGLVVSRTGELSGRLQGTSTSSTYPRAPFASHPAAPPHSTIGGSTIGGEAGAGLPYSTLCSLTLQQISSHPKAVVAALPYSTSYQHFPSYPTAAALGLDDYQVRSAYPTLYLPCSCQLTTG